MSETFISPFSELPLVSISTGIQANEKIVHDSLNALEIGKDQMNKFVDERISINSTMSFFDPIKKSKLNTFKSMNKVTTCKTKSATISLTATADLFSKIAIISQKRSIDLKSLFSYPLGPLPMSLAEVDGTLKKTPKSVLLHKLEKDVEPVTEYPSDSVYIVDGMAAVRQVKPLKSTYSEFAVRLLKYVLSNGSQSKRIDVVFDAYENNSIKDVERNRRSSGELSVQKLLPNVEIKQWSLFLSSNKNKNKLVDFIVKQWISNSSLIDGKILIVTNGMEAYNITSSNCILIPELESNHKEADSRMMLHVKHASRTYASVIIHTPDTDVFMIALSKIMEFDCQLYLKLVQSHEKELLISMPSLKVSTIVLTKQIVLKILS